MIGAEEDFARSHRAIHREIECARASPTVDDQRDSRAALTLHCPRIHSSGSQKRTHPTSVIIFEQNFFSVRSTVLRAVVEIAVAVTATERLDVGACAGRQNARRLLNVMEDEPAAPCAASSAMRRLKTSPRAYFFSSDASALHRVAEGVDG
jgi:hypothetical protein